MNGNKNMLPELPKKQQQKEMEFGLVFVQYHTKVGRIFPYPAQYELKDSYGSDSFLFNKVEPLQITKCLKIKHEGILIRNTVATSNGTAGIPDYSWTDKQASYIVIRYPKAWCFIDIEVFVMEKQRSKRKSLTKERAIAIAVKVINK